MASFAELSLKDRIFMERYAYRRSPWREMATLRKPLSETRGALVTTAALHLPDQPPFDSKVRGGDWSYREIPGTVEVGRLRTSHRSRSFDRSGIERDPNLAFPLERLRELAREGKLGAPMDRHFSFMGSITAPGQLMRDTAPDVAAKLREDGPDWVLLTPV